MGIDALLNPCLKMIDRAMLQAEELFDWKDQDSFFHGLGGIAACICMVVRGLRDIRQRNERTASSPSRCCVVSTRIEIFGGTFPPDELAGDSTHGGMDTSMWLVSSTRRPARCFRALSVARRELA
jgi:hypothetical protein